ncbi:MAG TPA: class I SAM-dependent methyltransferase [Acidobacteriota bacterium]|nr:class I SAM-dependent methyltransferase [Acidobacteriota bacterium]
MTRHSEQIRLKYTRDYYLNVCGGDEGPAFDADCRLPLRMAQLFSMARLKAHDQVLDLGCGRGELVCEAAKLGCEATGIDYSAAAIELARQKAAGTAWEMRCKFHHASITQNFPGKGQFDVILALDVFEHIQREELRHLLTIVKSRLKRGGRFVFHTSPNRHYYSIAYRAVWALSRLLGKTDLPQNSRCSYESEMHIGELTRRELELLLREADLDSDISLFGLERILHAIQQSGLGPAVRRRLAQWACHPRLRACTNSDIVGLASHDLHELDELFTIKPRQQISLDHPLFFHEGWYVPVGGENPHRWASPSFSVKAIAAEEMKVRFRFTRWPDRKISLAASSRDTVADTHVVENDCNFEFCLRWHITDRPVIVHFRATPSIMIENDPRLFGACLERIICEGS